MLVVADVGNTAIKLGVVSEGAISNEYTCARPELARSIVEKLAPRELIYSSVRPGFSESDFGAGPECKVRSAETVMAASRIRFADEMDLGIDRRLACIGAACIASQPFIVATFGTATTVSYVAEDRCDYSLIWPGLGISVKALDVATRIEAIEAFGFLGPRPVPRMELNASLNWGILLSTVYAVSGFMSLFQDFRGLTRTLFSGGYGDLVAGYMTENVTVSHDLVLKGILALQAGGSH